jgi:hypothetical protein
MDKKQEFMTIIENLSKFHREHEKFYAKQPLEQSVNIQEFSLVLKTLADRWSEVVPKKGDGANPFMGSEDLNNISTIQYNGLLFMEGEGEPVELKRFIRDIRTLGDDFMETGQWLSNAMEQSWETALPLLKIPMFASVLGERHRIILNDWQAAKLSQLVAKLIYRSIELLESINFTKDAIREDLVGPRFYPQYLYSATELLDRAADLASESAVLVHDNERRWRVFRKKLFDVTKESPVKSF